MKIYKTFIFIQLETEAAKLPGDAIIAQLIRCLHEHLSDKCVEFSPEPTCHKVKRYMKKCPEAKPYRPKMFYNSVHVSYHVSN